MADDAERVVVVVDVGSTLPGRKTKTSAFAWARKGIRPAEEMCSSQSRDLLLKRLRQDLRLRRSVALGFEAPLFIPIPKLSSSLSRARSGEVLISTLN